MSYLLNQELILQAYKDGLFPMAYNGNSREIQWICPAQRGQISITDMHIPRSLEKAVKRFPFDVRINTDFRGVIEACAERTAERPETWINPAILESFCVLHANGHAHSVECWDEDVLVSGLYGLAIGQVFCGESMFSRVSNASKIALVHLVARLWAGGFRILDTQFTNSHLEQFGVYEVPHEAYIRTARRYYGQPADFILQGTAEKDVLENYLDFRKKR
jgi:leucyl/phenylalanyl-tRNA--protein transferase